jgi:peptide/nickel transport system substrate-binding protein
MRIQKVTRADLFNQLPPASANNASEPTTNVDWKIVTGPDFPLFIDPVTAKIIPNVVKDWEISEDGRTTDLFLRRGMRWSDGEPFTADDWLFWWEDIYLDPDLGAKRPELEPGGELPVVEKVNDYQVRYSFAAPYPFFVSVISQKASQTRPGGRAAMFQPKHYLMQFHMRTTGAGQRRPR